MLTRTCARLSLSLWLVLGFLPAASAQLVPQNQCPGDCSPCLGEEDPFCRTTDSDGGGAPGSTCMLCKPWPQDPKRKSCQIPDSGERGQNTCTVVWEGTTPISCSATGTFCPIVP